MINYTISEFLGIFLIGVPVLVFATTIWIRGLDWMMEHLKGDLKENIFHHHFHYKAKK
ncbi:MAG TPA: hypothetical protein VMW50_11555 [Dehalococcoidia bacterium]|nr:hypothetical protein [Dehalococcoidia bacterium]